MLTTRGMVSLWFIPQIRSAEVERTSFWCRKEKKRTIQLEGTYRCHQSDRLTTSGLAKSWALSVRISNADAVEQCWTSTSRSKDREADALGNLLLCPAITLPSNLQHQTGRDNNSVLSSCFSMWTLWIQLLTKPISKMYLCTCNKHNGVLRCIAEGAVLVTCHDMLAHPLFCFW